MQKGYIFASTNKRINNNLEQKKMRTQELKNKINDVANCLKEQIEKATNTKCTLEIAKDYERMFISTKGDNKTFANFLNVRFNGHIIRQRYFDDINEYRCIVSLVK